MWTSKGAVDIRGRRLFEARSLLEEIRYLNKIPLLNKVEILEEIIKDKIDIILISKTKFDSSSPAGKLITNGHNTPFRLDRNQDGGGLLLYVRENIPCKILIEYISEKPIENIILEINLRSIKCVLLCLYNPNINLTAAHLHCLSREIDFYSSKYDNCIVLGDLNTEIANAFLEKFYASYIFKRFIKEPTCFKNVDNLSCLDLILTNHVLRHVFMWPNQE